MTVRKPSDSKTAPADRESPTRQDRRDRPPPDSAIDAAGEVHQPGRNSGPASNATRQTEQ